MAISLLASNNAQTVLSSGISSTATTLTVNTGTGSLFPAPVVGSSFFKLTLVDSATGTLTEIVHVTQRSGDVMTIERGREGTAPRIWSANDIAANMMTAGTLSYMLDSFQPLNANLTSVSSLAGGANQLPYFNGANTLAQTALTAVGRDLIGKATVAEVLTYLGLGSLKYGAPMIGELVEWPRAEMPQEIWPDCEMEFIPYMGQSFDAVKYPLLSQLHPTNVLPADMRGYSARGYDNGRSVDSGRVLMSEQADAAPELTGEFNHLYQNAVVAATGVFKSSRAGVAVVSGSGSTGTIMVFKASDGNPVYGRAAEIRTKNVAWNMIVRAK